MTDSCGKRVLLNNTQQVVYCFIYKRKSFNPRRSQRPLLPLSPYLPRTQPTLYYTRLASGGRTKHVHHVAGLNPRRGASSVLRCRYNTQARDGQEQEIVNNSPTVVVDVLSLPETCLRQLPVHRCAAGDCWRHLLSRCRWYENRSCFCFGNPLLLRLGKTLWPPMFDGDDAEKDVSRPTLVTDVTADVVTIAQLSMSLTYGSPSWRRRMTLPRRRHHEESEFWARKNSRCPCCNRFGRPRHRCCRR